MPFKVAFLGFSDFERSALTSYFRLALNRNPGYEQVLALTDADFLVADADHAPSSQLVVATERLAETVFVGAQAPVGHQAWTMRPIDALQIMRELDRMVLARGGNGPQPWEDADRQITVIQPPRRSKVEMAGELIAAQMPPAPAPGPALAQLWPPLPLPSAEPAAAPRPPAVLPRPLAPQPMPRALLVDDSDVARRFLESKLSRWRLLVDHAANSDEAVAMLSQHGYGFVFLDVELGPLSQLGGLELCRQIKQSPQWLHAAVIMVSAHHGEMDRVRGSLAGCDAYLGKPLDEVELQRLMLRQGLRAPKDAGATQN